MSDSYPRPTLKSASERDEWDEGRASERTVLAWHRSAISLLAISALVLRAGIITGTLPILAIPMASVLLLSAVAVWLLSGRVYRDHDKPAHRGAKLHETAFRALAALTLTAALSAAILVLAG
jgi:uncharacterized membrane protein YidH (DUF202 family)